MGKAQSDNYKFLMILAVQQEYIDKKTFIQCNSLAKTTKDKSRAVIEFLKKEHLTNDQFIRLLELYKLFLTHQKNLRFAELAVVLKLITQEAALASLEKQKRIFKKTGKRIKIGEILMAVGVMSKKQRDLVLLKQQRDSSIKVRKKARDRQIPNQEENRLKKETTEPDTSGEGNTGSPPAQNNPVAARPLIEHHGKDCTLLIQEDALKAYLKRNSHDSNIPVAKIIEFLTLHGVTYGLAGEKEIRTFLKTDFDNNERFLVARGDPMKESCDARFEYLFHDEFLTSGRKKEDGTMDFKDRGKMPMVSPGEALAKKHPPVEGRTGVNIFGDDVQPLPASDMDLNFGGGVTLSEDGLTLYAAQKGFPKKELTGCVSVVQEYHISGDVGYGTGHVDYDGDVVVSGTIKPGFTVSCNSITADAIEGGNIACEGNVIVANGILEAQVFARGNLAASFIHRSELTCMGNMSITREILDSKIDLDGFCYIEKGRILSSDVTAKQGVWVMDVGTTGSRQSIISAGFSRYAEKELNRLDELMRSNQLNLELRESDKSAIEHAKNMFSDMRTEVKTSQKKYLDMIELLKNEENLSPAKKKLLTNYKRHLASNTQQIHLHDEDADSLDQLTNDIQTEMDTISKTIQTSVQEMLILKKTKKQGNTRPKIEIGGQVQSGTKLCGRHSSATVKKSMTRVGIKEVQRVSEQGNPGNWELIIDPQ